jgi:hypothetical protein
MPFLARSFAAVSTALLVSVSVSLAACSEDSGTPAQNPGTGGSTAGAMNTAGTMSGAGGMNASGAGGAGGAGGGGAASLAGAGAGGGGAGGAGGSGGGAPMPVLPVMRDGLWAFDMGDVTLEVNADVGGRIATFRLGTENLLTGPAVNATYWGSTLWTSPEADWSQPPPAPIDSAPYTAQVMGEKLVLTGQPYAMLGVSVTKTFWAEPANGAFKIEYKLNNTQQTAIQMAPWEVTRVFPRGLTFFPTGTTDRLSNNATLPTTKSDGITWWAYDAANVTMDSKLWADGAEGWLAHVAQGLVFIKTFADVLPAATAPNEGDVELYANAPAMAAGRYIELENQAAYGDIAPAASATWTVTWYLRKLPDGMAATPSAALAQFVRTTIAAP